MEYFGYNETTMASRAQEKQPAPHLVRDRLREAIHSGKLQPGEQLRQEEIAERYGISRISVREALRQLEAEGLVTHQPNRELLSQHCLCRK